MDHRQPWYPSQTHHYSQNSHPQHSQDHQLAVDSVQDAQGLLAAYPMASATPTAHVARHLSSLTLTAAPPSFMQQSYHSTSYPQGNPPPYTEYAQEISYLSSSHNNSDYWESSRNEAVRLLGEQAGPSYPYPHHTDSSSSHWSYPTPTHSFYQTNPFAQSIFQRTAPSTAYPTPPPPGISTSSSSLAFALGAPPSQQPPPPPLRHTPKKQVYTPTPQESHDFLEDFLSQKTSQLSTSDRPFPRAITPPRKVEPPPQESPDPLALRPSSPITSVTPRKRKATFLESPSVKRIQQLKSVNPTPRKPIQSSPRGQSTPKTPHRLSSLTPLSSTASLTPRRMAYIAIPPNPWSTPNSSRKNYSGSLSNSQQGNMDVSDDDDLVAGSSTRRVNDRDDRAPLEKLIALFEDIFEAEDVLPPDADLNELPEFFSPLTTDSSHPLLHPNVIRKMTKYIGQVARPTKRLRHATTGASATPRVRGRMAEVETQTLSRILKMLDRNVRAAEDVDPFVHTPPPTTVNKSPRKKALKGKKPDRRSKSATPKDGGDEADEPIVHAPPELTDANFDKLTRIFDMARDSVLAAECCIALLGSDRLTKQLYSEELINTCLASIKNQLTKIIYPFVEASAEIGGITSNGNLLLNSVVKNTSATAQAHRRQLNDVFQALAAVIPRVTALVNVESVAMSDTIIIQAVYIAIGPFFVVEPGGEDVKGKKDNVVMRTLGKSGMRGLRLDALSLIRCIFANHENQRSWIIEEILSSLIKLSDVKQKAGQFRLRDGRSIRTVSALLLQLVQTSAHDVRIDARKIEKARQNKFALRRQESFSESQNQRAPEAFLDENDQEEIRLYTSGLDSATKAAKTIIIFLTQRSGKGKATKNSNEAEYRTIFDNLISDLLAVLYWPEWPAASLLLSIASKYMVSSLDDVKSTSQSDTNAAKTIALDHLGHMKVQQGAAEPGSKFKALKPLDEAMSSLDMTELDKLLASHRDVASHLCKRATEDQAFDSARELTAATLGQELAAALKQIDSWISYPQDDGDANVWKDPNTDVFDIGSQEEVIRIDHLAEEVGTLQTLRSSFQPILNIILLALDAPPIFMRTKALRALGQIVTSDATILSAPNVRRAIESHLLDSSPAVRDAAVELIGKYMIDSPAVAGDYYQKIADRIADTGLSVRKRVIKLLKSFYVVTEDARRIDIATRLVLRMMDEDDTVKDLAIKSIEELWFPASLPPSSKSRAPVSASASSDGSLLSKVTVIMGTSANFKDRKSPLEDMLHKIMADKQGHDAAALHSRYAEVCETLIDGLVDASDLPGFTVINCIRTIYLFTSAYPAILSGVHASTLLPYLKNATTPEEQATSDYLLKIFRASIPHMPKTAAKFGHELQSALQPMILKPSGGSVQVLQETVACMCTVVKNLTHDFVRLVNLVKSCNARLQQAIKRPNAQTMSVQETRALSILIFIISLLAENCDFDQLRHENAGLISDLNSITEGSIIEHIYNSLLRLYEKYDNSSLRGRTLQCLGFLFRAQPTLMTMESSATIMDAIFASPEEEGRGRLLKIMQEFLTSEASKHAAKEKDNAKGNPKPADVNMEELVGNTDGFADSGVSSAIVQRYLSPILEAALSQNIQIQATAIDVLSFTIKQGLAHPLQSFPVVIALETSPIATLSNRASILHAILHNKHASLLNTRYSLSAKASFDYQKKICSGPVRGFRLQPTPIAMLQRWYSLVREKRPTRQDFLKSLVKVFQENPSYQSSQDDVDFTRYMAENFATFEYKTQEEVFTVIKYLTTVLSTTGTQLLEMVSPSHLLAQLHGTQNNHPPPAPIPFDPPPAHDSMDTSPEFAETTPQINKQNIPLMRTSVIIAMVMLLKAHLKTLYSLSEDKCMKFMIGKKSAIGDKPATKRHDIPMSWDRLPFATIPLLTSQDGETQKSRFLDIWNEDGVTAEPEDDPS
ncbi:hypothetical protein BD779DRAFT_1551796 [Infundibulicybe gibba]|nr:hypothetical protein BD779DRAFT_1551796 [Infundibulicybe gibba]